MEKSEFRVLIKHYFLRKKTITETKAKLDKYYGDSALSISMVKKWFTEFRCGRTSTEDAERPGRPVEVSTPETIEKIHDLVLADRRLKVQEIVEAIGISHGSVVSILNDHLGMRKLSARWVARLLTVDHKRNRVTTSQEGLALFNHNMDEFLRRFVTVDEIWIHHNTPETKQQSKQWVSKGESAPKKAKVGLSANKVMATVFWDARGIIHIFFLTGKGPPHIPTTATPVSPGSTVVTNHEKPFDMISGMPEGQAKSVLGPATKLIRRRVGGVGDIQFPSPSKAGDSQNCSDN